MEEELKNLKLEIQVLKKRISYLEAKERNRKIGKIIKIVFIAILLIVIAIYGYKWYKQIMDYYNEIKNFIDNPVKSFL